MAYPVEFRMTDNETGKEVIAKTRFVLPSWVKTRSKLALTHFARIWCEETAHQYFGTSDVSVALISIDGVNYS